MFKTIYMQIKIKTFDDLCKKGIYCITNIKNGKVYIGSTTSTFQDRWGTHIRKLRTSTHPNQHLQNAFNLYSEDSFIFSIVEFIKENEVILEREKYYIEEYNSYNREVGYNIERDPYNREVSEETKQKISSTLKEGYTSGRLVAKKECSVAGWNKGMKCPQIGETRREMFGSIEVYDKNKELIATFRSIVDLVEWSEYNTMPRLVITNCNKLGAVLRSDKIHLACRKESKYKGLYFKKNERPLPPEMGIVKWENCVESEILNSQPPLGLTTEKGSETNS